MNALPFSSGKDFLNITSEQRAKMHMAKGGKQVSEVLIQEGVATKDIVEGKVCEPVVYAIGNKPMAGFFRTNTGKGERENLNSKGMGFSPNLFCPTVCNQYKEKGKILGSNITFEKINVYRFLARLGVLTIAKETKELE